MAGFFDKVSEFAKVAVDQGKALTQTAVDKGKELSEIAKINVDINKAKDSIKEAKLGLGEYAFKNGLLKEDETAAGYINEITEQLAKIETLKADIEKIKAKASEAGADAEAIKEAAQEAEAAAQEAVAEETAAQEAVSEE
jgi:capsule polysaccharide export protein KpsE/RkpR